jgi:CTP:molybdopterin cytidylyltransferase MocA
MTVVLPVLILAAGGSTRMRGRDKLMERVDGRPLIRRQAEMAREATAGAVIVALPGPDHARWRALDGCDVTRLPVPGAADGMAVSLATAIAALPPEAPAAMVLLADLPDLHAEDLRRMASAVAEHPKALAWRGTTEDGTPGHPVIFHRDLFDVLMAQTGDTGGRAALAAAGRRVVHVPLPGARALSDLDTPEAWEAWREANPDRGG